jgi:hypothetical protein
MTIRSLAKGIGGVLVLAASIAGAAAPADVAGTWKVTMDGDVQHNRDGSTTTRGQIQGTLVLTQKGADVTGTWTAIDEWKLTGRVSEDGLIELASGRQPVPFSKGREKGSVQARWVFRGTVQEGSIRGTAFLEIADQEPSPRKWSAVRR